MVVWWQATPRQTGPIPAVSVPASGQVRLLVVGDTGTGNENQMAVAAAMEQLCRQGPPPDGVLMLGDNFYQAGVSGDDDHQWQDKFLKPYGSPCLAGLTFWAVAGNHDYKGNVQAQLDNKTDGPYLSMPGRMYHLTFGGILADSEMTNGNVTMSTNITAQTSKLSGEMYAIQLKFTLGLRINSLALKLVMI